VFNLKSTGLECDLFTCRNAKRILTPGDVFCGYHDDTAASVVLQVSKEMNSDENSVGWAEKVSLLTN
jgi:hypothetical protein